MEKNIFVKINVCSSIVETICLVIKTANNMFKKVFGWMKRKGGEWANA